MESEICKILLDVRPIGLFRRKDKILRLDIVRNFEKATGVKVPFVVDPRRPGDVAANFANCDKAFKELHWKAKRNVEDACRDAYRFQTTGASK